MSSINDIFNMGKLGIKAQQAAIQVTSRNIANVNTDGYSRQEVVFEEMTPLDGSSGQVGTGALQGNDLTGINNAMSGVDSAMEQLNNVRAEVGARMNRLDTAKDYLDKLQTDLKGYKNEVEDADITQVITELTMQ